MLILRGVNLVLRLSDYFIIMQAGISLWVLVNTNKDLGWIGKLSNL